MLPEVSIVVPMRNEALNAGDLYDQLTTALIRFGRPYEIICVDDGSTDSTFAVLSALHARDPRVRVIRFRRNFGQTAAFAAGFAHARGAFIVTIDGDLQNDPEDIPRMVQMAEEEQLDIVAGWRRTRRDPLISRRLPSVLANAIISYTTGVKLHDYGCSLKVFRAGVVKGLKLYGEMHRFLPAIASEQGVAIGETVVNHRPRTRGKSNYGISRTVRVILDLMTVKFLISYSTRPLQMFGGLGVAMGTVGFIVSAWLAYLRLFGNQSIADRPLLLMGILLIFTGVQLVTLGLLAELQARTYHESQNKPIYVVRDILDSPLEPIAREPLAVSRRSDRRVQ
jgi:glycosyltransferase involved in cell wall biosynthesis